MSSLFRVKLNVGGVFYETSKMTLQKLGSPLINRLLHQQRTITFYNWLPEEDMIFLDRDPECFRILLNTVRYGQVFLTENVSIDMVEREAEFLRVSEKWKAVIESYKKQKEAQAQSHEKIIEEVTLCRNKMFESLEELREIKETLQYNDSDSDILAQLDALGSNSRSDSEPQLYWEDD